jgi:outer membrane protein OmpA-like peptidoglycan-associated protein
MARLFNNPLSIVNLFVWILLFAVVAPSFCQTSSFLPKNLGPGINSDYDELNPVISADGKTIYFIRSNHPENTYGAFDSQDIWYSELRNGAWSPAKRLTELNIGRYNAVLDISDDGKVLLLNGVFNNKGTFWKRRGLSASEKTESGEWDIPFELKIKKLKRLNRGTSGNAFLNDDGNVLIFSLHRWYNSNKSDVFFSVVKKNEGTPSVKWTKPKKIHLLSAGGTELAPFVSKNNKTIYLSSDDEEKGQFDIYKAARISDDWHEWTQPKKLSDTINTAGWESDFKTNLTGSYGFYSSTSNSMGGADIFMVKLFEENPFVIVSGNVLNGRTGKLLKKNFSVLVDGNASDSIQANIDSSSYKIKLPLRQIYSLSATTENYTSTNTSVDVSGIREFTTMNKDLVVMPLPYVHLTGRVLNRASGEVISPSVNLSFFIDGLPADSIKYNSANSTYEINIRHGKSYSLQAKADRYNSSPATLDLTAIEEFQEMNFDLYLEGERLVSVTGLVTDKKTGKPFSPASHVQLLFAGVTNSIASIDTLTSQYRVSLQPGGSFAITVTAPGCLPTYETVDLTSAARGTTVTKDLFIAPVEVGQAVRLNNIFFESGHATLKKESFPELDKVYEFLNQNPTIKIEIGGHTDNVGNATFNLTLSGSRAKAVVTYLTKKGISADRMQSKGYGMTKPVTSNATKAGKAQNRRVEFVILGK